MNKIIGTNKRILKLVKPLAIYILFKVQLCLLNPFLRASTLYATETMINMQEPEYRALEKIEESVLHKLLKTTRLCSSHLLYLETGIIPTRFKV